MIGYIETQIYKYPMPGRSIARELLALAGEGQGFTQRQAKSIQRAYKAKLYRDWAHQLIDALFDADPRMEAGDFLAITLDTGPPCDRRVEVDMLRVLVKRYPEELR